MCLSKFAAENGSNQLIRKNKFFIKTNFYFYGLYKKYLRHFIIFIFLLSLNSYWRLHLNFMLLGVGEKILAKRNYLIICPCQAVIIWNHKLPKFIWGVPFSWHPAMKYNSQSEVQLELHLANVRGIHVQKTFSKNKRNSKRKFLKFPVKIDFIILQVDVLLKINNQADYTKDFMYWKFFQYEHSYFWIHFYNWY